MGINDPHDRRDSQDQSRDRRNSPGSPAMRELYVDHLALYSYGPSFFVFVCDGVERPGLIVSYVAKSWFHDIGPDQMKAQAIPMLPCG